MGKKSSFFLLKKCLFLWVSPLFLIDKECASHFRRVPAIENEQCKETKTLISNAHLIRKSFQGYRCKSEISALI